MHRGFRLDSASTGGAHLGPGQQNRLALDGIEVRLRKPIHEKPRV